MPVDRVSFEMTNKQKCFHIFRPKVEEFCERNNLPSKVIFNLTLVLDELVSNIINYGYADFDEHPIKVELSLDRDMLTMRIEDDAQPFNILEAPEPELDKPLEERARPVGGMGVHLVKNMVNCVEYKRQNGKNIVMLEKRINNEDCCTC